MGELSQYLLDKHKKELPVNGYLNPYLSSSNEFHYGVSFVPDYPDGTSIRVGSTISGRTDNGFTYRIHVWEKDESG